VTLYGVELIRLADEEEVASFVDDERSNFGMSRQRLLDGLSDRPREVHRIEGELGAAAAADRYDAELEGAQLDLVLLGIGPDGHAASLFPSQATLEERSRRAIAAEARLEPFVDRVTMTVPVLCSAPEVLFLAAGDSKAEAVEHAFGQPPGPDTPASLIRSAGGRTRVVVDAAAAARLQD
jgi:6-phosphogluconolactonase